MRTVLERNEQRRNCFGIIFTVSRYRIVMQRVSAVRTAAVEHFVRRNKFMESGRQQQ